MTDRGSKRAGLTGVVIGLLLAFCGVGSGIYFGTIRPAIEAGERITLPIQYIVTSIAILILVALIAIYQICKTRRRPSDQHER